MGTGSSSKTNDEDDVRNRLNSGDFQKISPPSSPSIIEAAKNDEMSYSGILVEKPGTEKETPKAASAKASLFTTDLSTPPASNRSNNKHNNRNKVAAAKEQPRRIVKATPPPSSAAVVAAAPFEQDKDNDADSPSAVLHSHASPIGANAATELLEESIEKNASKNKRLERVTNKQKSDREKLLQEKRRRQQPSNNEAQANPFSRFLKAFSVHANPTHKRKEKSQADADDPNKRLKYGFDEETTKPLDSEENESNESETEKEEAPSNYSSWIAAASFATIAVLVVAILRGSKKK